MAKLPRVTNKLYGSEIELEDIGQFGSAKSGSKVNTKDIPTIQGDEAWKKGWTHATMSSNKYPTRQERNGMDYSFSYQIDYLLREGLPEYDAGTEYNKGSMVKQLDSQNKIVLYQSLIDNNIGLDLENPNAWQEIRFSGGSLEVCDIGMALYIDESKGLRRYLNGQTVDINSNTQKFLDRLLQIQALHPNLFCSNEDWESAKTLSAFGQVGRFVLNYADDGETVESVKLPRVVNVQGLFDLANLGMTVSAGLPNITGNIYGYGNSILGGSGSFYHSQQGYDSSWRNSLQSGGGAYGYAFFDASRSSSIYGNSTTVQPEAIQYPYFIQIATGAETENNIVNDIELNNPFSFGDSKYSPIELNNISWLKSSGQWNSKAVYPDFYDWVLENVNNQTKDFKSSADTYDDYDFVINTADETFRLPIKNGKEGMFGGSAVVGNGMGLGLYNGTKYATFKNNGSDNNLGANVGVAVGASAGSDVSKSEAAVGVTTDPTKSGLVTDPSSAIVPSGWNLYYYVGETVQNANLINAGRLAESLSDKIGRQDCKAYITETYVNGASGYNIYSNGYCEQWGEVSSTSSPITITLLKTYANTKYNITTSITSNKSGQGYVETIDNANKTNSAFKIYCVSYGSAYNSTIYFKTAGYLS